MWGICSGLLVNYLAYFAYRHLSVLVWFVKNTIFFFHWVAFVLCQKSIDHICVGLLIDCLLCCIDPYAYPFSKSNTVLDYGNFIVCLKAIVWMDSVSSLTLFFCKIVLTTLVLLPFHVNFRIALSISQKTCWAYDWNCVESVDKTEKNWHLNNI